MSCRILCLTGRLGLFAFAILLSVLTAKCEAVVIASDVASDAVYDNGWQTGDNGGTGFGSWTLSSANVGGVFIGNSTGLSSPGADINTSGESFGMFAENFSEATRSFTSPLNVGDTFSLEIAVNFRNGNKGVDLRDASSATIFNFNVGGDDYRVNNATPSGTIGNSYSANTEFLLSFTQTSGTGGTWSVARSGGLSDLDTGVYSGVAAGLKLYVNSTGGGSPNDFFANSFAITAIPEASPLAAIPLAFAIVGALGFAFRKQGR